MGDLERLKHLNAWRKTPLPPAKRGIATGTKRSLPDAQKDAAKQRLRRALKRARLTTKVAAALLQEMIR